MMRSPTGKSASATNRLGAYNTSIAKLVEYKKTIAQHFLGVCGLMNQHTKTFAEPVLSAWIWNPPHDEIQDVNRSGEYVIARAYQVATGQALQHNLIPELVEDVFQYVQLSILNKVKAMCAHVV